MTLRLLFAVFVLLALLGDARITLFILNRMVWGNHREEKNPWSVLLYVIPPVLVALTLLFWPLNRWIARLMSTDVVERIAPDRLESILVSQDLATIGAVWLIVAGAVGILWIVERAHAIALRQIPISGVLTDPPTLVRLRRAHIPVHWLQRLGAHNDLYDIEVTHHEVFVDDLPTSFDGYRIAFLTDTHVAGFVRRAFYREILGQVRAFEPDAVIFGGDFVTWHRDIALAAEVLTVELRPRDGMFAILGNHDYWAGADEVVAAFAARGVEFIVNRSAVITRGSDRLPIVGIDEVYRGRPDVDAAFAGVGEDAPCIGVSHHPDIIDLLDGRRIDLLLCGHTHGGQIRFPFFGAVVVPSLHEAEYASGFHRVRRVLMYVSRGIGAIPPVRILCRPEVATFVLRKGTRTA